MSDDQEKLTTATACQLAGMNREKLIRRVQAGEICGEQVAGRWLIDPKSLTDFLDRQHRHERPREEPSHAA